MLRKHGRGLLFVLALALVVGAPTYAALTSANYANCAQHQGHYPTKDNNYNKSSTVLVPAQGDVRIFWRCVGGYANENGNAITAASTFLLLIVTGLLGLIAYRQYTTTRAQLRAYIFVESASIQDQATPPNVPVPASSGCPFSRVIIKNFGQTPAINVRHFSAITVCQAGTDDTACPSPPDSLIKAAAATVIGPAATTSSDSNLGRALTPYEVAALLTVGQALYVYGRITYEDVFGRRHETTYRLGYAGVYPPHPHTTLLFTQNGNSAR
jgi:hypothetical protein